MANKPSSEHITALFPTMTHCEVDRVNSRWFFHWSQSSPATPEVGCALRGGTRVWKYTAEFVFPMSLAKGLGRFVARPRSLSHRAPRFQVFGFVDQLPVGFASCESSEFGDPLERGLLIEALGRHEAPDLIDNRTFWCRLCHLRRF